MSVETAQPRTATRAAAARPAATPALVQRKAARPSAVRVQPSSLRVSSPSDPAEKEADSTAKKVVRMSVPESTVAFVRTPRGGVFRQVKDEKKKEEEKEKKEPGKDREIRRVPESPYVARFSGAVQRMAEGSPNVSPNLAAELRSATAGGEPLPLSVRRFMEPRFRADFSGVRIHTGERAAGLSRQLGAKAFATGSHVFFGRGQYQPESTEGRELIAHELTHTLQQGGATRQGGPAQPGTVQRSEEVSVTQHAPVQVQRFGIGAVLDRFASWANAIPGFRMFTIVLGVNPINMSRVERSAANILRAVVEFIPGGGLITRALDEYGIFERIGGWVEQQIRSLGMTGSLIRDAVMRFVDSLSLLDLGDPGGVWERAKRIFTEPIDRILGFVRGLASGILGFIKDAILRPLAGLASRTRGYDLLKAVLGQDPITGEPYPRNADTLIGGFMKLIGQEEVWADIKRANAVARAWSWFQGALSGLLGFVRQVPQLFMQAVRSLGIEDLVLLPRAFVKVGGVFLDVAGRFFSWAGAQVMSLLEIIFEVVAPGAMTYLRRAAGAFRSIIRNPIGFIGNLVRAGIQGFRQFAAKFLTHLRASLIGWLTGAMSGAGLYIPQAFTVREILKFVLSVLGLTWQNIRQKLVRVIGEPTVRALEAGFEIVQVLVTQGPAAAWEKIQEGISNLREMVMEQIMTFVSQRVVQAAVTRLLTSLNPAGAFVQAVIAIYNTIMFFVERLRQIAQVAMSFIDSMSAIASGAIGAAANRVEQTMAGLLTLVISFLARIAGLGKVSDAVKGIIDRVRAPIDRALDRVVEWIVAQARRLGRLLGMGGRPAGAPVRIGKEIPFDAAGESHRVWFRVSGTNVEPMVASSPMTVSDFLASPLVRQASGQKSTIPGLIQAVRDKNIRAKAAGELLARANQPAAAPGTAPAPDQAAQVDQREEELVAALRPLLAELRGTAAAIFHWVGRKMVERGDINNGESDSIIVDVTAEFQDRQYFYERRMGGKRLNLKKNRSIADLPDVHIDSGGVLRMGQKRVDADAEELVKYYRDLFKEIPVPHPQPDTEADALDTPGKVSKFRKACRQAIIDHYKTLDEINTFLEKPRVTSALQGEIFKDWVTQYIFKLRVGEAREVTFSIGEDTIKADRVVGDAIVEVKSSVRAAPDFESEKPQMENYATVLRTGRKKGFNRPESGRRVEVGPVRRIIYHCNRQEASDAVANAIEETTLARRTWEVVPAPRPKKERKG